jgi:hypothetical protein
MDVRRAVRPVLLLVVLAAMLGSAVTARAGTGGGGAAPTPLPADQATALADANPGGAASGSSTSAVDANTALAASNQPDAQTSIESDMSAQDAVGLTLLNGASLIPAAKPTCWASLSWHQWGTWPYEQRITDTTYWCAVFDNHITYRTSTTTASGTLCGINWRAGALIGGGIGKGFTYFTNRASAGFSCETVVPWITLHRTHYEDTKRNDRGVSSQVGSS